MEHHDHLPPEPPGNPFMRLLPVGVGALLVLGVVYFIWSQMNATTGVKVEAPPPAVVNMLPPPPPPPPPPPQNKPPEPQDKPNPAPVPNNEPPKPAAAPVTINGPAQAGSDSFGLQSGSGGGTGGSGSCAGTNCGGGGTGTGEGMSEVFYRRYLSAILQERIQRNDRLNRLVFTADFAITISPGGRIIEAKLLKSSGRSDRDQELRNVLLSAGNLDPPPSAVRFPQKISVRGRRSI